MLDVNNVAWNDGFRTGQQSQPSTTKRQCPYPAKTQRAWNWQAGYVEGVAVRQAAAGARAEAEAVGRAQTGQDRAQGAAGSGVRQANRDSIRPRQRSAISGKGRGGKTLETRVADS